VAAVNDLDITGLLGRWQDGDKSAEESLLAALYPHLRAIAQREIGAAGHRLSLRATELVNESYLRLVGQRSPYAGRNHFMAIASRVMRRVLVDILRAKTADKRGGGMDMLSLEPGGEAEQVAQEDSIDWLALEEGLVTLERRDTTAARVVELRYFGGLNNDEVAGELGVGVATVVRHWQFARAWLHRRL
jgi:RNA polymerase sigma factor (TIGR02999 family)